MKNMLLFIIINFCGFNLYANDALVINGGVNSKCASGAVKAAQSSYGGPKEKVYVHELGYGTNNNVFFEVTFGDIEKRSSLTSYLVSASITECDDLKVVNFTGSSSSYIFPTEDTVKF